MKRITKKEEEGVVYNSKDGFEIAGIKGGNKGWRAVGKWKREEVIFYSSYGWLSDEEYKFRKKNPRTV